MADKIWLFQHLVEFPDDNERSEHELTVSAGVLPPPCLASRQAETDQIVFAVTWH
eukprot:m.38551 g.38551  ORF g.38551 m.38551 type:complete len:55 (-) comp10205_c0_seq4:8680-8844(-)